MTDLRKLDSDIPIDSQTGLNSTGDVSTDEKASVPMITYSKRRKSMNKQPDLKASEQIKTPTITSTSTSTSTLTSTQAPATRRVLSQRKKLQEFYKLHTENQGQASSVIANEDQLLNRIQELRDAEALARFVKESSAQDMLKVRNEIAQKLNYHDLEKKTIIYDNYLELIKLDQTLASVKDGHIEVLDKDKLLFGNTDPKLKTFHEVFAELQTFVSNEAAVFNQDFRSVVSSILSTSDANHNYEQ